MYKCQSCNYRTEDIDEPSCPETCKGFKPIEITTLHRLVTTNKQKVLLCTGKPPRNGAVYLGGNYGISCIRCRKKMKEQFIALEKEANTPIDEEKPEPEKLDITDLPEDEIPDKISFQKKIDKSLKFE